MSKALLCLFPLLLAASDATLLSQAEAISELYSVEVAKAPPPPVMSMASTYLQSASNWLEIDLRYLEKSLPAIDDPAVLQMMQDIGFDTLHITHVRQEGSLQLSPERQAVWNHLIEQASLKQIAFAGDLIGNAIAPGADFFAALQNRGDYPGLFHLIEVRSEDWDLLPPVPAGAWETNIPWLTLQELHKRGYVPERFTPYVKTSDWNATDKVMGLDGKARRWIYLKEGINRPCFAWLSPSFGAYRLAAGDALGLTRNLGCTVVQVDGALPELGASALALWIRKIGAFSCLTTHGTLASIADAPTDFAYDSATPIAMLHALIAQSAGALQTIYRLFLENKLNVKTLIHELKPLSANDCDWIEFLQCPNKKYQYFEEQVTGSVLRKRLLKEDLYRLKMQDQLVPLTWVDYCKRSLGEQNVDLITSMHVLLAFAYAMQPGIFAASLSELAGAVQPDSTISLTGANENCLYASLPVQRKNPKSFVSQLGKMIQARNESGIAQGELIGVLASNPGTLLLMHRLPTQMIQVLALNFANKPIKETIEHPQIAKTTAINLMSGLAEEKVFSSALFSFTLAPISGKVFYFQPKYYTP